MIVTSDTKRYWTQHKVGRGGTPYTSRLSNPIKQVNGQIYGLSHYLKHHDLNHWINGIIYFSNQHATVDKTCLSNKIPILAISHSQSLCDYIIHKHGKTISDHQQQKIIDLLSTA